MKFTSSISVIIATFFILGNSTTEFNAGESDVEKSRVQVLFDAKSGVAARRLIRIFDLHPELGLEFYWTPSAGNWPGVDDDGFANGSGTVTWHIPGAPEYDSNSINHRYTGEIRSGRFEGTGELTYRDGRFFSGQWVAGLMQGEGIFIDAKGNRYEGTFENSLPHGFGTYIALEGWIYRGRFENGLRHGMGEITPAAGPSYSVMMNQGVELSNTRADTSYDPMIGGLTRAQAGKAGDFDFTISIDRRVTQEQEIKYSRSIEDGKIIISPAGDELQHMAFGNQGMLPVWGYPTYSFGDAGAYVVLDLKSNSGKKAKIDKLWLSVSKSYPLLRPALDIQEHAGCVGFRPSFHFTNEGWGKVENASLKIRFAYPTESLQNKFDRPASRPIDLELGDFNDGKDVLVESVLSQLNVSVDEIASSRPTCPNYDSMPACSAQAISDLAPSLGEIADYVGSDQMGKLNADILGEIKYEWTDAFGNKRKELDKFVTNLSIAQVQVENEMAECADAIFVSPQVPNYIDMQLPFDRANYYFDFPLRGNRNIKRVTKFLKMRAERSSVHELHAEAHFADGSIRYSMPLNMTLLNPRSSTFTSETWPEMCYLQVSC